MESSRGITARPWLIPSTTSIVHAEVFGNGQDHDNLAPMLSGAQQNMETIGKGTDYFKSRILSCDANYHNKENLRRCAEEEIDAYIPDMNFRKRDERYKNQDRFRSWQEIPGEV